MAGCIHFKDVLLDHPGENRNCPIRIFAETPFASGAFGDFAAAHKLPGPGFKKIDDLAFFGVHGTMIARLTAQSMQKASQVFSVNAGARVFLSAGPQEHLSSLILPDLG
jgi:hypothetical protein